MNYLELDINKLFEDHTIKEVEAIQKQIQQECDRKKIELRTLVGERYRDLIQAADTIAEMKTTSESIVSEIAAIEDTFRHLQEKYLIGFKIDQDEDVKKRSAEQDSNETDYIVMQVKILMDIPEQIWSSIDDCDFLKATQLFLLAQYINFSMSFVVGVNELAKEYPIVAKQWGVILQFKNSILNRIDKSLKSFNLETELAANCLAALVLLEGYDSEKLLDKLISSRNHAVSSIVTDENHHSVRNRIKMCYKVLMETVLLIHRCFVQTSKQECRILELLKSIKDTEIYTMLLHLDMDVEFMNRYVPEMTCRHKPFHRFCKLQFPHSNLTKIIKSSWLKWVKKFIGLELTKLLELIVSIKGIYNIREEALAIPVPDSWTEIWEDLKLPAVNFWLEYFQPLLTKRVKGIIDTKTNESLTSLKQSTNHVLDKVSNDKCEYPEHDLRWFVWKDSPTDVPQKLTKNSNRDINKSTLFLKTRGLSPNIEQLCSDFDQSLLGLLTDLEPYLYETEKPSLREDLLSLNSTLAANKFADREEVQTYLQEVSGNLIRSLVEFGKTECLSEQTRREKLETNAIVIARFFQALAMLCPNLTRCFAIKNAVTNSKWQQVCDNLRDECCAVWMTWAKLFDARIEAHSERFFAKITFDESRLNAVVNDWEKVTIEEEAEEGKRIKSDILVPYQASVTVHNYLSAVCDDLNKILPHTLPKTVVQLIVDNVVLKLLSHHAELSTDVNLRQKQAIQLLFDVKYATLLMVPRENRALTEKSNDVCNNLVSKVDPFDLDVFYPYIYLNVKKAVQRSLLIYGNLVPHLEQLHSVLGARAEHSEAAKPTRDPPGVLAVCTGAPWFPPLAVMAPAKNLPLVPTVVPEKKKKTKEHTRNDSTGSTIKSGAAAFFGAMGSDWFGTSS